MEVTQLNRRAFLLGLFGIAPVVAVAGEAKLRPSEVNDFIRSRVRFDDGEGWERVPPEARYIMTVRDVWRMEYVGEPIKWTADV